jgi:uncharacterized small protein (DUF1192 family)
LGRSVILEIPILEYTGGDHISDKKEDKVDLDDLPRQRPMGAAALAKEVLDNLSLYELKERIELLEAEIARTRGLMDAKQSSQSAAAKLFK